MRRTGTGAAGAERVRDEAAAGPDLVDEVEAALPPRREGLDLPPPVADRVAVGEERSPELRLGPGQPSGLMQTRFTGCGCAGATASGRGGPTSLATGTSATATPARLSAAGTFRATSPMPSGASR